MKFYKENYSANLMTLVIYSHESLETLENWVIESFSPVKNYDYPSPHTNNVSPFGGE